MKGISFSLDPFQEEQILPKLWHKRLGHYYFQGLLKMQKFEMVRYLTDFEIISSDCHACQYGKQSRIPFPITTWRATKKL